MNAATDNKDPDASAPAPGSAPKDGGKPAPAVSTDAADAVVKVVCLATAGASRAREAAPALFSLCLNTDISDNALKLLKLLGNTVPPETTQPAGIVGTKQASR